MHGQSTLVLAKFSTQGAGNLLHLGLLGGPVALLLAHGLYKWPLHGVGGRAESGGRLSDEDDQSFGSNQETG